MENQVGIFNNPEVLSLKTELRELEECINNIGKKDTFMVLF